MDSGHVERGHHRVVERQADEEEIERDEGPAPDGGRRNGEEQRVEAELDDRHDGEGTAVALGKAGGGARRLRP